MLTTFSTRKCSLPCRLHTTGFSLLELLATLSIIAILLTSIYPSYSHHIAHARRGQAINALLQLASKLENYYSLNNSYNEATLENLNMSGETNDHSYQLHIDQVTEDTYRITAIPQGAQAKADAACGNLQLDETGERSNSGEASATHCWI